MRSAQRQVTGTWPRRAPVWLGMAVVAAASWVYLGRMDAAMSAMGGASAHAGMAMGGRGAASLAATFLMWAVMMMAMMLPTVAPSALVFSGLSARRDPVRASHATASYVVGYAAAWIVFAATAAVVQWALTHAFLLDPMARSTNTLLSAAILLAAGVYQVTPLKAACLSKCRTPLGYLMAQWRDGASGALWLGLRYGVTCVVCCWALMAVMFVVGAMNLAWMGLLTLLLLGEKLAPARWRLDRVIGLALFAAGLWAAAGEWPTA